MSETKTETQWHLGFGVDVTGKPHCLNKAMQALNAHAKLVEVCELLENTDGYIGRRGILAIRTRVRAALAIERGDESGAVPAE